MAEGFDTLLLARWFCQQARVYDIWQVDPRQGRTEAWTLMGLEPQVLGVQTGSTKQLMRFKVHDAVNGEDQAVHCPLEVDGSSPFIRFLNSPLPELDLQHVCLLQVVTRGVCSNMPIWLDHRFDWYHTADGGRREQADRLLERHTGANRGVYLRIEATAKEGKDVNEIAVAAKDPNRGFLSLPFVATMALVTKENLLNGIVHIPRDVCLAARLPVWTGRAPMPPPHEFQGSPDQWQAVYLERTADEPRPQTMYAIPINHVLAWSLRNTEYANSCDLTPLHFQFRPPAAAAAAGIDISRPVILYYLLPDLQFQRVVAGIQRDWLGKVDMRPLSSMAFDYIPECDRTLYPNLKQEEPLIVEGFCVAQSYLTYLAPKRQNITAAEIATFIPTLCPGFPEPDTPLTPDEAALLQQQQAHQQDATPASELGLERRRQQQSK